MPRLPPSSRVVSLTAEPTPALSVGIADRISAVDGAVVRASPQPHSTSAGATARYAASGTAARASRANPAAIDCSPVVTTRSGPKRSAKPALRGATSSSASATGICATAAVSGE